MRNPAPPPRPLPDDQPGDPLQTIADLRRELAQCRAERDEVLARETATAEVLQVINSSPGDLAPVFDAMLEKAMRLCGAAFGELYTYDGERLSASALKGIPAALADFRMHNATTTSTGTMTGRILQGQDVVHVLDLMAEDAYQAGNPQRRALVDLGGARTALAIALRRNESLLGLIMIYRQEVCAYADKQIALLQNFAAQAVIAMENARLITETREALEQQTATAEVLQVINASPGDLAPVFDAMLEKAHRLCGLTNGVLVICDGDNLRALATHGLDEPLAGLLRRPFRPLPNSPHARMIRDRAVLHIPDLASETVWERGDPKRIGAVEQGVRTMLFVPLCKEDKLLGYFSAARLEARPFSGKEISLLQNFAAQAVIAIENARLITETREALEQQTATAEVLGVINSSPGDLAPVFDAMLEKAFRLCVADQGVLWLRDGEVYRPAAYIGVTAEYVAAVAARPPLKPGHQSVVGLAALEGRVVQIADIAADPEYASRHSITLGMARTGIGVPLLHNGETIGVFGLARRRVEPFTDKQIALLQNFAAQAVIAIENARLITETRDALEQQTATAEVLRVINSSPGDLAPVFEAILEKAHTLCGAARGTLFLFDGETFRAVAVHGYPEDLAALLRQRRTSSQASVLAPLLAGARLVHIPDLTQIDDPIARAVAERGGVRTNLLLPLRKDGALLGLISCNRLEVLPFTDKQIALLETFAAQAVIAMENARLLSELRARTDEIAGWNKELEARVAAQLAEIERTGRLRRFLAPQLADLIVAQGDESILESHRREIVVVFCDLRGFTGFAERAEPEEVMALLKDYHAAMGPIVASFEGTLDHYAGDGIMVFFNDPVPTPDPARRAIDMAVAMRAAAHGLLRPWRRHGHDIGFGVGISQGYATLGQIGFAERMDYTAIGTVTNLAARLCAEAKDGQILVSGRVAIAVEDSAALEEIGDLALKGLRQAVAVYNVAQPAT